ncbi:hypothetical protein HDV01_001776 [Terramyces sp. JEL0728]|nr:hypothetical protein HDV01_001776 [Terramyces sp. JEL0728]
MHSKRVVKPLPNELIELILRKVPQSKLVDTMCVSKSWHNSSSRILYSKVKFTSVAQREKFFSCLQNMGSYKPSTRFRPASALRHSPTKTSTKHDPSMPPPVVLRRRSSLRSHTVAPMAKLIKCLDFGLAPNSLTRSEPNLPSAKSVLSTPKTPGLPISALSLESPIPFSSERRASTTEPPKFTRPSSSRVENIREKPALRIETESQILKIEDLKSPYGSWSHRFVSPSLPLVGQLIPHLKGLSLKGCHVNASDFTILLETLTQLEILDVSYSTLKTPGLSQISRFCRHRLVHLDISGIFKLGRNKSDTILDISAYCTGLKKVVALDCPEIYDDILEDCKALSQNRIEFVTGSSYE